MSASVPQESWRVLLREIETEARAEEETLNEKILVSEKDEGKIRTT